MSTKQGLLSLAIFIALAVPASLLIDRPITELGHVATSFARAPSTCRAEAGPVVSLPELPTSFFNNGFMRFIPCERGTLRLLMRGTEAKGRGALALVSQKGSNLWEEHVSEAVLVEVDVEPGFWVTIAFVNDAADEVGDRNLWIDQLAFDPH